MVGGEVMNKPEPSDPRKVSSQGWSFYEQVGYNQACADWEAYHDQELIYHEQDIDNNYVHKSKIKALMDEDKNSRLNNLELGLIQTVIDNLQEFKDKFNNGG